MFAIDETPSAVPRAILRAPQPRVIPMLAVSGLWIAVAWALHHIGRPYAGLLVVGVTQVIAGLIPLVAGSYFSVTQQSMVCETYLGPWRIRLLEIPVRPGQTIVRAQQPRFLSFRASKPPFEYENVALPFSDSEDGRQMVEWLSHRLHAVVPDTPQQVPSPAATSSARALLSRAARITVAIGRITGIVAGVLVGLAFVYYALAFGPGARLALAKSVHARVPAQYTAFPYGSIWKDDTAEKTYLLSNMRDEYSGLMTVEALKPSADPGFRDPARMARYARSEGAEVRGPARFAYAGFEVTTDVEPTMSRSRHQGAYTCAVLASVEEQRIYIRGDNVSLRVAEDASAREMAIAAIDMLQLEAD